MYIDNRPLMQSTVYTGYRDSEICTTRATITLAFHQVLNGWEVSKKLSFFLFCLVAETLN
jgi:hypothetical protein